MPIMRRHAQRCQLNSWRGVPPAPLVPLVTSHISRLSILHRAVLFLLSSRYFNLHSILSSSVNFLRFSTLF